MKLLTAKEIKKIVYGIVISDGSIDMKGQRFDLYIKHKEYAEYVYFALSQITGMDVHLKLKRDKRGHEGWRVWTRKHAYWKNIGNKLYTGRKTLSKYVCDRLDPQTFAHIWMCDGYLEHSKNRRKNTVQNIGWFCLESFDKEELELLQNRLLDFNIKSSLIRKPWGFGWRIRIGGENLQRFISMIYPYILDCFKYKTVLFYKSKTPVLTELSSAEQYVELYSTIEDIVRHPMKVGKT